MVKKIILLIFVLCCMAPLGHAQATIAVSASHIQGTNGTPLSSGSLCFQATDQNNNNVGVQLSTGGIVIMTPFCTAISNGAISTFNVPNPGTATPLNVRYRITITQGARNVGNFPGAFLCLQNGACNYPYTFSFDLCLSSGACLNNPLPLPTGPAGPPGLPCSFQGTWAIGTSYSVTQCVIYSSAYYVSLIDSNLGYNPATSPSQWAILTQGIVDCGSLPTSPNSVPQICQSTPSGGVGQAPAFSLIGTPIDPRTTTTEVVNAQDRNSVMTMNNSGATALSIVQMGTSFATSNFTHCVWNIGAGLVTYTPTTSVINGNASQIIPQNWFGCAYSDNTQQYMPVMATISLFPTCTVANSALQFNASTGAFACHAVVPTTINISSTTCSAPSVLTAISAAGAGTCSPLGSWISHAPANFGANISNTTIFTPSNPTDGLYEVVWYVKVDVPGTSCGAGSNTAALTILWNDALGNSESSVVGTLTISANGSAGAFTSGILSIETMNQPVQYSVSSTLASTGCSPAPTYIVDVKGLS